MFEHIAPAARRAWLSLLLALSGVAAAQDAPRPAVPASIAIKCVQVRDVDFPRHPFGDMQSQSRQFNADDEHCMASAGLFKAGTLTGAGDLVVTVTQNAYKDVLQTSREGRASLLLFVNGVPLPVDAELISVENRGSDTFLRYRINQGADTQTLWAMLYRQQGLLGKDSLRAGLGWSLPAAGTATYVLPPSEVTASEGSASIEITSAGRATAATLMVLGLLAGLFYIGRDTDALRDAPLPDWWKRAIELRAALAGRDAASADTLLKSRLSSYDPQRRQNYLDAAATALARAPVRPEDEDDAMVGLALQRRLWKPVRASFSLARVQMALWFAFAIAAGLFLWIVYGQLRRIDNSVLILLGLSVGTAGVSLSVDRNSGGRDYTPSKGIFSDLVTGFDDKQQVHRYQAVVVNLLLLFVGISHVLQHLTYPIFEPTWLALLGVSGVALGVGKQASEQSRALPLAPAGTTATTAPAAGSRTAADGSVG